MVSSSRFLLGGMGGVTFLPVELQRAQEQACAQLPAHHIAPLVDQHRQVAVGLDPLGVHVADDGLGGGAHHQRLFQFFAAADGDHGQFGRETFHVFLLFFQEGHRDEEREGRVDVPGLLEAPVEGLLDVFPQRPAVRAHDHAAAHRGVIGQLGAQDDLVVPFGEILIAGGEFFVRHNNLGN